jgi:hypothetical protein
MGSLNAVLTLHGVAGLIYFFLGILNALETRTENAVFQLQTLKNDISSILVCQSKNILIFS